MTDDEVIGDDYKFPLKSKTELAALLGIISSALVAFGYAGLSVEQKFNLENWFGGLVIMGDPILLSADCFDNRTIIAVRSYVIIIFFIISPPGKKRELTPHLFN